MNGTVAGASGELTSLNVGRVAIGNYKGKEASSGIVKSPVGYPLALSALGLAGDEQADLVHHGGPDKAVCAYPAEHYPYWEQALQRKLPVGAFGENFTVAGLAEADVLIGDVYEVGTATLQVSQPRQPCWKLAMRWGLDELPLLVAESGATGYYFRTLVPGEVRAGDRIALARRHPAGLTVAEANRVMHRDREDAEGIRRLLAVRELSASWNQTLSKRLARLESPANE